MKKSITQDHNDGWTNLVTQLGTQHDKRTQGRVHWERHNPEFWEELYTGDELANRIVNIIPKEALRKGWEWTHEDVELTANVDARTEELKLRQIVERAWCWARAYGGGIVYIVTDTPDPASPLVEGENVLALRDLSMFDLRILSSDIETDFGSPNYGLPNIYYLTVFMGSQFKGYPIHHSRMVRFDGAYVPRRTFIRNNYWHDSVLNKLYNSIRNYQTSNDAVATMLQDFNVDVYKMKNLANLIGAGKEDIIKNRLEMISYSKSVIRAMIIDADEEDYENKARSIEGVAELLTKQANRLVAATDIPHTKLLGESPDGSSATGNSTTQQWYDEVQSEQENYLRPKLKRLTDVIFPDLTDLGFKFKSLYQLTDLEEADRRNKTAQTDQIYLTTGVLDPSEVAESRFGGDQYSTETTLDLEGRESGEIGAGSGQSDELFNQEVDNGEEDPKGNEDKKESVKQVQDSDSDNYALRNQEEKIPEKVEPLVSLQMSEPFRDPKTDPKVRQGGIPNQARIIAPSIGNGITAPYQMKTDGIPIRNASVVAVLCEDKMLLGKRDGKWVMPGGTADTNEPSRACAVRELREETAIEAPLSMSLLGTNNHMLNGTMWNVDTYQLNLMKPLEATSANDPDKEVQEWHWIDISHGLPKDIVDNLYHQNIEPFKHLGILK